MTPREKGQNNSYGMRPESLGHSDMEGGDQFDFTKEDKGSTGPLIQPERHFRPPEKSREDVKDALKTGDKDAFERALHRLQDSESHWNKGKRWDPPWKLGHVLDGTKPDKDPVAWEKANELTKPWVDKWYDKYGKPDQPSGGCN